MFWTVLGIIALVVGVLLWRDLTRRPDPTARPGRPSRTADGPRVAHERAWDGVRPQGSDHLGPGPL